jgi:hypothetical protein
LVDAGAVTKNTAIDSTYVKARRGPRSMQKGAFGASNRPFACGWTTKIHALTDVIGRP